MQAWFRPASERSARRWPVCRTPTFQHHLMLNVTTTFHCIRAALPPMQAGRYGRIVNMASVTGPLVTIDGSSGYATAKAAVTGLTRATALEYARHGITCNAVLPGWIQTGSSSARELRAGRATPATRPGTPAEVAACCLFLASEEASYVNGAMLVVDGANTLVEMKGVPAAAAGEPSPGPDAPGPMAI